jgi:hypothetical protein
MSDINQVNINKQKKPKRKLRKALNTHTYGLISKVMETKSVFIEQVFRRDVLENIWANRHLTDKEMYNLIMSDNNTSPTDSRRGDLYETLCEILLVMKCIDRLNYTNIMNGDLSSLKQVKNIKTLLKNRIHQGGNVSDISIKVDTTAICFSIKYKKQVSKKGTDINDLDSTLKKYTDDYKIGLFVKSKQDIIGSKKNDIHKEVFDQIKKNDLLFDETDIIKALNVFCERFSKSNLSFDDFIELINTDYLLSPRQQLTKKLHQKMTELKFIRSFLTNKHKMWCIAHKPRSGKSILLLSICKYLLENRYKKILIMTSVPATIDSFINDLEKYIDFKDINYKLQEEFDTIDEKFNGIVFCSVQYLKTDGNHIKKDLLKKMGFDAIITDEAHLGGSTDKTKNEILDVDIDVEEIRKNIKLNIFASGTADKTKKYYGIHNSYVYEWEIQDESFMKELNKTNITDKKREEIVNYMVSRHGNTFTECLENETLNINKDYSECPTQILMKHSISKLLIEEIKEYNSKYGTNFGYSCSSLFALSKSKKTQPEKDKNGNIIKTKNGDDFYDYEYNEEFELCKTTDGIEILKGFFDCVISNNKMKGKKNNPEFKTIMTQIEETQFANKSRQSKKGNPLLFILYLPTHTRNNTISLLQRTIKKFLSEHSLWCDYNIEYSNSTEDTGNFKEEYNEYIQTIMNKTKTENKKGCILLLGNKGSVGITYKDCDVTISLDDGHNLDNQKQRFSRALTEADGKTIGINVDMNIQRTYLYLNNIIQKHRKNTKTTQTNAEILYYLFEHNIFLFDPQQINNGKMTTIEIMSYYQKEAENIMENIMKIDDTPFLDNIICDDDMRSFIKIDFQKREFKKINKDLEGEQQDCPKGDKTKVQVDAPDDIDNDKKEDVNKLNEEENAKIEHLINQTYEMCRSFLFPLLALISRTYKIFDFKEIFTSEKTKILIISLLKNKKIELNKDNYISIVNIMKHIIDNNAEIVNNIREIYSIAPAYKLRGLIEKHFIPTQEEKKGNAEYPTPVKLVDEMLNTIPVEFWKKPQKVFEPCCGKGNFVLGIFDRFYKGLEEMYPDEIERCRVIMTECIYYADLTALNVFITTEIMKCHVQSYCGLDELDFEFNNYTGDTLELNIEEMWNIVRFTAIIGNPPYNDDSGNKGKGHTLWTIFVEKSLKEWLLQNGYLLFVNPSLWRQTDHPLQTIMKQYQIEYLEIHDEADGVKIFNCNTRYDWYLINKVPYFKNTKIKTQTGELVFKYLNKMNFIPNYNYDLIDKLTESNDKVDMLYSRSDYASDKKWTKKINDTEYKYPVVYSVNRKHQATFIWSNINTKEGHYKKSKVIFGSGATGFIIDEKGDYACCEFCTGIIDKVENLEKIKNVLDSLKFKNEVIKATSVSKAEINRKILKHFKKDFWKEFI